MDDFVRYLEEARLECEAEEMKRQDVFLNVIDRARVEAFQRVKEDPLTMWNVCAGKPIHKLYDADNPGVIHTVKKEQDTFGNGFLSGLATATALLLMALIVWWVLFL